LNVVVHVKDGDLKARCEKPFDTVPVADDDDSIGSPLPLAWLPAKSSSLRSRRGGGFEACRYRGSPVHGSKCR